MKKIYHPSASRGYANHGWLDTYHTFSFGGYYNPERMNFGKLRVLNDDTIDGGTGFDTHPHDNMEIVSIGLNGCLAHKDSMGNKEVIHPNEVQVMSAGTGIKHSEFNDSASEPAQFLQIWIYPDARDHTPRYGQQSFDPAGRINQFQLMVSPEKSTDNLWLNQDAYLSRASLGTGQTLTYNLYTPGNGIYIFIVDGEVSVADQNLVRRDGLGVWEVDKVTFNTTTDADILVIEVPMK